MFCHSLRIFGRRERIRLRANIMLLLTHMHCTLNVILVSTSKAPTRMFACCRLHGVSRIWIILTKKMASVEVVETSSTNHIETTTMPRVISQELCRHNFKSYVWINKNYIIKARGGLFAKWILLCNEFRDPKQLWKENPKIWKETTQADKRQTTIVKRLRSWRFEWLGSLSKDDVDSVSAITSQLFKVITLAKCVLTILELNWNLRFWDNKTTLNICHHMLTSSTQLQNRSYHVVERTRTSAACLKNEICTCKACETIVFRRHICKFVTFSLL